MKTREKVGLRSHSEIALGREEIPLAGVCGHFIWVEILRGFLFQHNYVASKKIGFFCQTF